MANCAVHQDVEASGICIGCGKFFCEDCLIEVKGKNYCRNCLDELIESKEKKIEKLEDRQHQQQPMVFMNAGGASSSSSSSVNHTSSAAPTTYHTTKSKLIAGLLALFLGGFGIHKFYLGKWGQGLLYLVFCWTYIPGIIGFIEGIVYLVSDDEKFARKHDPGYRRQ